MYFSPQVVTDCDCVPSVPLIECPRAPLDGEVAALAAALLVLVQDQLLEFLLLVPAVEVRLDGHLDLLLPDLGCGASYGAVRLSTDTWAAVNLSSYSAHPAHRPESVFLKRQ